MPLTKVDKEHVFRLATRGLLHNFGNEIIKGMTDEVLSKVLAVTLGIFGGSGGPDRLWVSHQASGLRIWGGWHSVNHVAEKPLFKGVQTVRMARFVYDIVDPGETQLGLDL